MKEIIFKYMKEHGFGEFNPKAVLFDMDGVLYNSMPNHAVAWQESMKQFDIHMTAADAYATEGARGIEDDGEEAEGHRHHAGRSTEDI